MLITDATSAVPNAVNSSTSASSFRMIPNTSVTPTAAGNPSSPSVNGAMRPLSGPVHP